MPTQVTGAEFLAARRTALLADEPRVGKEQPVDAIVMTSAGPTMIGNLRVGDFVSHPFDGDSEILEIHRQGVKQAYRVSFRDGSSTECGIDHLWVVRDSNSCRRVKRGEPAHMTLSLREIMRRGLVDTDGKSKFKIPVCTAVEFHSREYTIPPYALGALIGDGGLLSETMLSVPDRDNDILERIRTLIPEMKVNVRRLGPNVSEARLMSTMGRANILTREIRRLCLNVRSGEKFLPETYRYGSKIDRIELLRGLMDTDGHCGKSGDTSPAGITRDSGTTQFHTKSIRLAKDVLWLVQSLGGLGLFGVSDREKGREYRVTMQLPFCPFYTPFKLNRWRKITTPDALLTRAIVSIEPTRMVEQVCIRVGAEDGMYLTDNFIVTHNTGAAILASELIQANRILVITTASGRGVWRNAFALWAGRRSSVIGIDRNDTRDDIWIVSYDALLRGETFAFLMRIEWNLLICDEDHKIKSPDAKRTQAVYGRWNGRGEPLAQGLTSRAERVWHLTGTPLPHDPGDMWCRLRSSNPEALFGNDIRPDVLTYDKFRERYCVIRMKKISNFNSIPVVVGGRNLPELRARIGDWMLRRTQADVGIRPPTYDLLPLIVSAADRKRADGDLQRTEILDAAARGDTKKIDMDLGPLRRLTGVIKAHAIIDAVRDELDGNSDKIVLMYFHRGVGDILEELLGEFYPVRVDGATPPRNRDALVQMFHTSAAHRIFLGQIDAAGEAVDLSAASVLWFVETVFSPKSMAQAALRITNINQKRNCFVKVCCLAGSIDESIQASLIRLWASIREVIT